MDRIFKKHGEVTMVPAPLQLRQLGLTWGRPGYYSDEKQELWMVVSLGFFLTIQLLTGLEPL